MSVRVVSASQAAELDRRAIASGVNAMDLMRAAGRSAATLLLARFGGEAAAGVQVYAGAGNNGGDAWIVAAELVRRGVPVCVVEVGEARSDEARTARGEALSLLPGRVKRFGGRGEGGEAAMGVGDGVVVDGLLGYGASGAPRGDIARAIAVIASSRRPVVALDVPSGVDATTGETLGLFVRADLTVTFGSLKRGLLLNRDAAGAIVVTDIGFGAESERLHEAPALVDAVRALDSLPQIAAGAHKGTRRRLLVVGGAPGMAGATVLAARAAMRSGVGMVKLVVAPESVAAVQAAQAAAMALPWPSREAEAAAMTAWAQGLLIGPGIGHTPAARTLVEWVLRTYDGPAVIDADGLNVFEGDAAALGALIARRPCVVTPHAMEFSRLASLPLAEVMARRFDVAGELARTLGATVLLKGVPTVISDGDVTEVCATGTPVLATAGSGDVLAGIVATILAQSGNARGAAATGAWVHGRAAELAGRGTVRGVTLDDVVAALRDAWRAPATGEAPVLVALPAVGDRASA